MWAGRALQTHGAGGAYIAAAAAAGAAPVTAAAVYFGGIEFVFVIAHGLSSLRHIASGHYMQMKKSLCV